MEESFRMLRLGVVETSTMVLMSQDSFEDHLIIKPDYQRKDRGANQKMKNSEKWLKAKNPTEEGAKYCKGAFLLPLMLGFDCGGEAAFGFLISLPWAQLDIRKRRSFGESNPLV